MHVVCEPEQLARGAASRAHREGVVLSATQSGHVARERAERRRVGELVGRAGLHATIAIVPATKGLALGHLGAPAGLRYSLLRVDSLEQAPAAALCGA